PPPTSPTRIPPVLTYAPSIPTPQSSGSCRSVMSNGAHPRQLHSFPTRRSSDLLPGAGGAAPRRAEPGGGGQGRYRRHRAGPAPRSEEHTSELQSRFELVCRLVLDKKNAVLHDFIYDSGKVRARRRNGITV